MSEEGSGYAAGCGDMSGAINEIAAALAKAQATIRPAAKDGSNPHFTSRYSTLAEVWDTVREALTGNGIAVVQLPRVEDMCVHVVTMLTHSSGQWLRSDVAMPLRPEYSKSGSELKPGVQQVGSAITYGRRYGLCAMAGVASADEDDDGNAAAATRGEARGPRDEGRAPREPVAGAATGTEPAKPTKGAGAEAGRMGTESGTRRSAYDGRAIQRGENPLPAGGPKEGKDGKDGAGLSDPTAFNAPLYDACTAAAISCEELTADLKAKGILKGTMTIDNLGPQIVDALLDGKDKASGKRNWDLVVSRIKEHRK